jgi:hypothetical protein
MSILSCNLQPLERQNFRLCKDLGCEQHAHGWLRVSFSIVMVYLPQKADRLILRAG